MILFCIASCVVQSILSFYSLPYLLRLEHYFYTSREIAISFRVSLPFLKLDIK